MAEDSSNMVSNAETTVSGSTGSPQQAVDNSHISRETSPSSEPERMLPQSKVNEIVGRTRQEERERVARDYQAKIDALSKQQSQASAPVQTQQQQAPSIGGMQNIDEDRIRQVYHEEAKRLAMEQAHRRLADDFLAKVEKGKEKYQDYEDVVKDLNIGGFRLNAIEILNEFENVPDMLYELSTHPEKLNLIPSPDINPTLTRKALRNLSESIKANETAVNKPKANPPLSQISSSPTTTDNGQVTINDLRKQPWLRG